MTLEQITEHLVSAINNGNFTDFEVKARYSDSVNEIRLKALNKNDKSFHVLVLESIKETELFGDDSKGGEKIDGI